MHRKTIWYIVTVVIITAFVVLSTGFYKDILMVMGSSPMIAESRPKDKVRPSSEALVAKGSETVNILVLGDSIAKGTGDDTGKGFAGNVSDYLKNQTMKKVAADNEGINGEKSKDLLSRLQSGDYDASVKAADSIILSIGGNDLITLQFLGDLFKEQRFKSIENDYLNNLKEIVQLVRKNNKNACLAIIGLYNPTGSESDDNSRFITAWNADTQKIIDDDINSVFIPTYDIFKSNLQRYLYQDGLHPNKEGYEAISERIGKSVENVLNQ